MEITAEFINTCFPIVGASVYKNGCYKICRKSLLKETPKPPERKKTVSFTKKSLTRLMLTMQATDIKFRSMITLTYPKAFPTDGAEVKENLRVYTQWLKRKFDTEVLWFLEFQKRGAPHFHILVETECITPKMRFAAGIKWSEIVCASKGFLANFRLALPPTGAPGHDQNFDYTGYNTHCMRVIKVNTHHTFWEREKKPDGMRHYATKYAAKTAQKKVPKTYLEVGRFWGCSSAVKPKVQQEIDTSEEEFREFLNAQEHLTAKMDVLPTIIINAKAAT